MAVLQELVLGNIDKGDFLPRVEADFKRLQDELVAFAAHHEEAAEGAEASLNVTVTLKVLDPKDLTIQITAQSKLTPATPPPSVSVGMGAEGQDGAEAIYVREGGSDGHNPRQGRLCDSQGNLTQEATQEAPAGEE